jgi:DNA adenine methylase
MGTGTPQILDLQCVRPNRRAVNVASVRQLSPFRYPGGKTWLVPEIRRWLAGQGVPAVFVEPFAGGAIASLTVAAERLAHRVVFCELDHRVAAVWHTILEDGEWLCQRIQGFEITGASVRALLEGEPQDRRELAFQTVVRNRVQHGGIMAPGASLMKAGENGRGVRSRWYARTLVQRIRAIRSLADRLHFIEGDGFAVLQEYLDDPEAAFFIDPPYTAGGKRAGRRLYTHNELDHERLFAMMATAQGRFLMSYDNADEVLDLAQRHGFCVSTVPMKNTHHEEKLELLIADRPVA